MTEIIKSNQIKKKKTQKVNEKQNLAEEFYDSHEESKTTQKKKKEYAITRSPYKDPGFKKALKQLERPCSVPGCTSRVGKGLRFLCDLHYRQGG